MSDNHLKVQPQHPEKAKIKGHLRAEGMNMSKFWKSRFWFFFLFLGTVIVLVGIKAVAQGEGAVDKEYSLEIFVNSLWLVVAGALVFFMNAGFALLEAGSCSRKSLINVLTKNLVVFCITTLAFWLFGFSLMFGDGAQFPSQKTIVCHQAEDLKQNIYSYGGRIGLPFQLPFPTKKPSRENKDNKNFEEANPLGFPKDGFTCLRQMWADRSFASLFFFQLVFAGTASTIVSGAVAERVKFSAFCLFSFILTLIIYPWVGHWAWGPFGWLAQLDFRDFAGATVVHSVGGTAAFIGAWLLKPRWTRFHYDPQNEVVQYVTSTHNSKKRIKYQAPDDYQNNLTVAHSPGFVTLGGFILWLGWIGFNGGSTTDLLYVPYIVVTTLVASAAGGLMALVAIQSIARQDPSLGTFINGILGGLVAITASSAYVDIVGALFIGMASGIVVVVGETIILPTLQIDDPVGAIPVHLFCGFWGTVAVGLFASKDSLMYVVKAESNILGQLHIVVVQVLGWAVICGVTAIASILAWGLIGCFIFWGESLKEEREIFPQGGGWWNRVILYARHGIRLSVVDEYVGTYPFFSDPERSKRRKFLKEVNEARS